MHQWVKAYQSKYKVIYSVDIVKLQAGIICAFVFFVRISLKCKNEASISSKSMLFAKVTYFISGMRIGDHSRMIDDFNAFYS